MPEQNAPWPLELRLAPGGDVLRVSYDDGVSFALPAEFLRVESPSAEVRGHSPAERVYVPGKRNVTIRSVEPTGNYAVRLIFDDGHSTGIYSWAFLRELGEQEAQRWATYLAELEKRNLRRDPA